MGTVLYDIYLDMQPRENFIRDYLVRRGGVVVKIQTLSRLYHVAIAEASRQRRNFAESHERSRAMRQNER
ncbi:hypothetical protein U14_01729 [Candidatus Moduliflexus flocculans]|uniref:Uncharacterized protein n=1 Tax=Candidatus Moduliflexus flocculans TaxID=1499966 RepID=A0A0S6VSX7_9BACT|nr:hypothetical protein U14_01729 [Candidatus Moduliflexus flocculans]